LAKAEIFAGICGFNTEVEATMEGSVCKLKITSQCDAIQRLAEELTQVEPYDEIAFKSKIPRTLELSTQHCHHAACPVPSGIIKAIEIESGLALPADVAIKLSK